MNDRRDYSQKAFMRVEDRTQRKEYETAARQLPTLVRQLSLGQILGIGMTRVQFERVVQDMLDVCGFIGTEQGPSRDAQSIIEKELDLVLGLSTIKQQMFRKRRYLAAAEQLKRHLPPISASDD